MGRSKPASIRFDPEKLNLVQLREGLESPQKAVDYLMDAYWWEYKLNPRPKSGEPTTEYESIEKQIKDAEEAEQLALIKWSILKSKSLNSLDKQLLMTLAAEKINKLKS